MNEKLKPYKGETPEWVFNNELLTQNLVDIYFGFIYCIINITNNKKYIGRKYFYSTTRKKVKDKKRKIKIIKESDWKNYWGSCPALHIDIYKYGVNNFKREIISLHLTKGETNLAEVEEQFKHNVLKEKLPNGEKAYYNSNIMNRYFSREESGNEKHSISLKSKWAQERDYMLSVAFGGNQAVKERVQREYDLMTESAIKRIEHMKILGKRSKEKELNPMYNKQHTEESKIKIGSNRDYSKTNRSSQNYKLAYEKFKDKRWLNNGEESKFVLPEQAEILLKDNWVYGRLVKTKNIESDDENFN